MGSAVLIDAVALFLLVFGGHNVPFQWVQFFNSGLPPCRLFPLRRCGIWGRGLPSWTWNTTRITSVTSLWTKPRGSCSQPGNNNYWSTIDKIYWTIQKSLWITWIFSHPTTMQTLHSLNTLFSESLFSEEHKLWKLDKYWKYSQTNHIYTASKCHNGVGVAPEVEGWWFDSLMLQSACKINLVKYTKPQVATFCLYPALTIR